MSRNAQYAVANHQWENPMSGPRITRSDLNLICAALKLEVVTLHNKLISDLIDAALVAAGLVVFIILIVT
ncbi:hypothetical protein [Pseudomonas oryzicola]|uniref:Uncharacterized protein n=1 Tax=Pseudomonas oryzicola TaxID=485876 RepID=A0ABS6Q9Z7_9PSED|nr:hypothetical protein [Pseudomonas oryzicola]MBV4490794.1 hypothetical protein [Pseudomonas oryzicola]